MRINIVVPDLSYGGAEQVAINLANSYAKLPIEVTLTIIKSVGSRIIQLDKKIKIIELNRTRLLTAIPILWSILIRRRYDVVISVLPEINFIIAPIGLILLGKTKTIGRQANTLDLYTKYGWKKYIYYIFIIISSWMLSKLIVNSEGTAESLKRLIFLNKKNIKVIGNPVLPVDYLERCACKIDLRFMKGDRFLINVARLTAQKDHVALIKIFKIVRLKFDDVRLLIIGSGPEKNNLEIQIKKLNLEKFVFIIPPVDNPYPYYREASIFTLTSKFEGFGNVLVEALGCGTPVISFNCPGGPSTILNHGMYGTLIDEGMENIFADEIIRELDNNKFDPNTLVKHAQEFSSNSISKKYLATVGYNFD